MPVHAAIYFDRLKHTTSKGTTTFANRRLCAGTKFKNRPGEPEVDVSYRLYLIGYYQRGIGRMSALRVNRTRRYDRNDVNDPSLPSAGPFAVAHNAAFKTIF